MTQQKIEMSATLKFDTSKFEKSIKAYAAGSRKTGEQVLRDQAKLFVRDVAMVTPPNQGKFTQRNGVARVKGDIAKIMRPVGLAKNDPAVVHKRFRNRVGRVSSDFRGRGKKDRRWAVSKPRLDAYRAKKLAKVGLLASGWVAAAMKFGARLPKWIARHGSALGQVRVSVSREGLSIRISNSVPYVGNVKGLRRQVQWALNNRARQMDKQLEDLAIKRAAKKAGLNA